MSNLLRIVFVTFLAATSVASFAQSQPVAAPPPVVAASGVQSSTISVADKHDALIATCRNIADWRVQAAGAVNAEDAAPYRKSIAEETLRLRQLNQHCPGDAASATNHKVVAKPSAPSGVSTGPDVVKALGAELAEARLALAKANATKEECPIGRINYVKDGVPVGWVCRRPNDSIENFVSAPAVVQVVAPIERHETRATAPAVAQVSASASAVAQVVMPVVPVSSTPKCGVNLNNKEVIQEWAKTPACDAQIVAFSAQFKAECLADTRPNPNYATDLACGRRMTFLPK